jgi:hypothetical protein
MSEESDRLHRLIYESLRIAEDNDLITEDLRSALVAAQRLREELRCLLEEMAA